MKLTFQCPHVSLRCRQARAFPFCLWPWRPREGRVQKLPQSLWQADTPDPRRGLSAAGLETPQGIKPGASPHCPTPFSRLQGDFRATCGHPTPPSNGRGDISSAPTSHPGGTSPQLLAGKPLGLCSLQVPSPPLSACDLLHTCHILETLKDSVYTHWPLSSQQQEVPGAVFHATTHPNLPSAPGEPLCSQRLKARAEGGSTGRRRGLTSAPTGAGGSAHGLGLPWADFWG